MQAALQALIDVAERKTAYLESHLPVLQQSTLVKGYVKDSFNQPNLTTVAQFVSALDACALGADDFKTQLQAFIANEVQRLQGKTEHGFWGMFTRYFSSGTKRQIQALQELQTALRDDTTLRFEQLDQHYHYIRDLEKNAALIRFIQVAFPESARRPISPIHYALTELRPPESRGSAPLIRPPR